MPIKFANNALYSGKTHEMKCDLGPFMAVQSGLKPFEIRKNDRDFQIGDRLMLQEQDVDGKPTGRYHETGVICSITSGEKYGLVDGYVALAWRASVVNVVPQIVKEVD